MFTAIKKLFTPPITEQFSIKDDTFEKIGIDLKTRINKVFSKSLAIRVLDSGSDNSTEIELVNLLSPYYDVERFGISFVASPRHADILIVTGCMTHNMKIASIKTYEAMPFPKFVIALGDDACDGGILRGAYGINDGAESVLPVDIKIPGDPPTPEKILEGLLALIKYISEERH